MKIALVGTGAMASKHAETLSGQADAELVTVCSTARSKARAVEFQQLYGFRNQTQEFDSILRDPEVEAVYICTPDATHPLFTVQALEAGKHVFCEKPLARNERGFRMIADARERTQGVLQVGMNCRYREQYSLPKKLAEAGELGDLRFIRGVYLLNKVSVAKRHEKAWWLEHPQNIFFFLHANGIHILDLVRWYGGRVVSVFARGTGFELGQEYRADTFSVTLGFESGAIGEVLISSVAYQPRDVSLQMWFQNGSVLDTTVYRRDGEDLAHQHQQVEVKQTTLDLGLQFEDFLTAVSQQTEPMNNFHEALRNYRLIHAIERSLETGLPTKPEVGCAPAAVS